MLTRQEQESIVVQVQSMLQEQEKRARAVKRGQMSKADADECAGAEIDDLRDLLKEIG